MKNEWIPEGSSILDRLEEKLRKTVNKALVELGDRGTEGNWLMIEGKYFHQLPDLLRAWDFAYDLEKDISEYEEEEK